MDSASFTEPNLYALTTPIKLKSSTVSFGDGSTLAVTVPWDAMSTQSTLSPTSAAEPMSPNSPASAAVAPESNAAPAPMHSELPTTSTPGLANALRIEVTAGLVKVDGADSELDRRRLVDRVAPFDTDVQSLQLEAHQWRNKCLETERDRTTLAASEDKVQVELRDAQHRERQLAAHNLQLRIDQAEAERAAINSDAEARAEREKSRKLEEALHNKEDELRVARGWKEHQDKELVSITREELRKKIYPLSSDRDLLDFHNRRDLYDLMHRHYAEEFGHEKARLKLASSEAQERISGLEARNIELQKLLDAAVSKQTKEEEQTTKLRAEIRDLEANLRKLRTQLQRQEHASNQELSIKHEELQTLRKRNEELLALCARLQDEIPQHAGSEQTIQRLEQENTDFRQEVQKLREGCEEVQTLHIKNQQLEDANQKLKLDYQLLQQVYAGKEVKALRARVESLEAANRKLEDTNTLLRQDQQKQYEADKQLRLLHSKNEQLEEANQRLRVDWLRQAEADKEMQGLRRKNDQLEESNKQLQLDLQEALNHWADLGGPLQAATTRDPAGGAASSPTTKVPLPPPAFQPRGPLSAREPLRPWSGDPRTRLDVLRGARSRQLRQEVLSARAAAASLPIRSDATSRHDTNGHLQSWDAQGLCSSTPGSGAPLG